MHVFFTKSKPQTENPQLSSNIIKYDDVCSRRRHQQHRWHQQRDQEVFPSAMSSPDDYEDVYADETGAEKAEADALTSYIEFLKEHPHFEPNCEGNAKCEAAVSKQIRVLPTNQKMVFGVGTFMAWIAG